MLNKRRYPVLNFGQDPKRIKMPVDGFWLDAKEAANYLRVSVASLHNMVFLRQVPSYKLGRRLRFKRTDLDLLIEASKK